MNITPEPLGCLRRSTSDCGERCYNSSHHIKCGHHQCHDAAHTSPNKRTRRENTLARSMLQQRVALNETEEDAQGLDPCAFCEMSVLYFSDLPTEEDCMLAERCYTSQVRISQIENPHRTAKLDTLTLGPSRLCRISCLGFSSYNGM